MMPSRPNLVLNQGTRRLGEQHLHVRRGALHDPVEHFAGAADAVEARNPALAALSDQPVGSRQGGRLGTGLRTQTAVDLHHQRTAFLSLEVQIPACAFGRQKCWRWIEVQGGLAIDMIEASIGKLH